MQQLLQCSLKSVLVEWSLDFFYINLFHKRTSLKPYHTNAVIQGKIFIVLMYFWNNLWTPHLLHSLNIHASLQFSTTVLTNMFWGAFWEPNKTMLGSCFLLSFFTSLINVLFAFLLNVKDLSLNITCSMLPK